MKVRELIEQLQKMPQDSIIVMAKDAEGNDYSPLSSIEEYLYVHETTWYGYIYIMELTEELREHGYTEEDLYYGKEVKKRLFYNPLIKSQRKEVLRDAR